MPVSKDLKRLVRSRMQKTGESYTAARTHVLQKKTAAARPADLAKIAGMSDDAVKAKTGKTWRQWVKVLDARKATSMVHKDIARYLNNELGVTGWWAQTLTVGYERIRGLREKGQRRGGGYDVNKSKTYPVPLSQLYKAFGARLRKRWLGETKVTVKKAAVDKSMRLTWEDGTPVDVYFWGKGRQKSQVQLQHRQLPTKAQADKVRGDWTARLEALGEVLQAQ